MGHEILIFECNMETKWQSSKWHTEASPHPKAAQMSKSRVSIATILRITASQRFSDTASQRFSELRYSPNLAPADYYLFPKVKSSLKEHYHGTPTAAKEVHKCTLKGGSESADKGAFEPWKSC